MVEKKKEEKKKGLLGSLFKPKGGCCCGDIKFVPIKEEQQKNFGQEKK